MKPRVRLLAVGGTISTAATNSTLPVPSLSGQDLVELVPGLEACADVEVEDYSRQLSSQLSAPDIYGLARRIRDTLAADSDIAGLVVTHGTGTLEESAFMSDLLVDDDRPVVFTGAMRSTFAGLSDGPFNLLSAVRVAGCPESRGKGTLVVINGEIHAARDAYKCHTSRADSFASADSGPLGYAYPDRVQLARAPLLRRHIFTETPVFDIDLITFAVGMDDRFVRASVSASAAGIVIEGSGTGNLNQALADGVAVARSKEMTVVLSSRVSEGRTFPSYGTRAGGGALAELGCLFTSLSGPKARILLMLALGNTRDPDVLQGLLDPT